MQSAATAAALRLDAAVRDGQPTQTLLEEVRASLLQQVDVLGVDEPQVLELDEVFDRIAGTWQGLCAVQIAMDEAAEQVLADDPVLRSIAVEIISEAVSNAVRHGQAANASVRVSAPGAGALVIEVADDGQDRRGPAGSGLGSQLLDECTTNWSLREQEQGHQLLAELPVVREAAAV
jgi:signal transduction histidine kinase